MSPKAKKILITTEKREVCIVRPKWQKPIGGFCPFCQKETGMMSLDSAVTFTGRRARELLELIERSEIHSIETTTGHLLVCRNSLKEKRA